MAAKPLLTRTATAATVYAIVERQADGFFLNDANGAFAAAPADPYVPLVEHATIKGFYGRHENRTAWTDGEYRIAYYAQAGGAPSPVADTLLDVQRMQVASDSEVTAATQAASLAIIQGLVSATFARRAQDTRRLEELDQLVRREALNTRGYVVDRRTR